METLPNKVNINSIPLTGQSNLFTPSAFAAQMNSAAEYLGEQGLEIGSRVMIDAEHTHRFVILVQAIWKAGGIVVPVNPGLREDEFFEIAAAIDPALIITGSKIKTESKIIYFEDIPYYSTREGGNSFQVAGDRTAVIIFTSGSTGKPKGAELTFGNLYESYRGFVSLAGNPGGSWLASLPFYHVGGFSVLTRAFFAGSSVYIPPDIKAETVSGWTTEFNPGFVSVVPTVLGRMLKTNTKPPEGLKYLFVGGGPADKEMLDEAYASGWPVTKVYGSTETASMITALPPGQYKAKPLSAGKPLGKNRVRIIDDKRRECKAGMAGRISVHAASFMKSYINAPFPETERGYAFMNDIGYRDEEGYLYITGRSDDIVISGGENIDPREVERVILRSSLVNDVYVTGRGDKEWGVRLVAYVVPGLAYDKFRLKEYIKEKLASYKIPKEFIEKKNIPRNEMGKIQKDKLD